MPQSSMGFQPVSCTDSTTALSPSTSLPISQPMRSDRSVQAGLSAVVPRQRTKAGSLCYLARLPDGQNLEGRCLHVFRAV
jgi:hypothetical protein